MNVSVSECVCGETLPGVRAASFGLPAVTRGFVLVRVWLLTGGISPAGIQHIFMFAVCSEAKLTLTGGDCRA